MIYMTYSTTSQLANSLGIKSDIPSWDIAATPINETVGTGDDSKDTFYLDQKNILDSTYTLYYGSDATTTTTLTDITHYILDKTTGKIVLTSAGITLLSTNNIYAAYSYINNGMNDEYLATVIARADIEVNKSINSIFTDGTAINPSYPVITEIQSTEGTPMDRWILKNKPVIDIVTELEGDIAIDASSLVLVSGQGSTMPSTGTIIIGREVITYTGVTTDTLTGLTRGALGSTATIHLDGVAIHTTIIFISDTAENTAVTWTPQAWDTDINVDSNGTVYRFNDASPITLIRAGVQNRFKAIYLYGYNTIPADITRLSIIYAKRQLIQDNIGKSLIAGRNEFQPEVFSIDNAEIKMIVNSYIILSMGNV